MHTPIETLQPLFVRQREHAHTLRRSDAAYRLKRLRALRQALLDHRTALIAAGLSDAGKPAAEVLLGEVTPVLLELADAIRNLKSWMKPYRVRPGLLMLGSQGEIRYEPRGVCLILAPWNFPVALSLGPLVSALAAGNTAIIKPSELTPALSQVIVNIVAAALPPEEAVVVTGDADVAEALLALPFDHVFFTGSPAIGKRVMAAASQHLTSVTLELGGKCPAIVLADADIEDAVTSLVAGKYLHCGQICLAPDHVLVDRRIEKVFLAALSKRLKAVYGDIRHSADYARIINDRHHARLQGLLDDALASGATVVHGGVVDRESRLFGPTILTGCHAGQAIMHEEIFGPLLPVLAYDHLDDAIAQINTRDKPLALYVLGKSRSAIEQVLSQTSAGGTGINLIGLHFVHQGLPFGGVNTSGIGKVKGWWGFLAFSNERAVLDRARLPSNPVRAPYGALSRRLIDGMHSLLGRV